MKQTNTAARLKEIMSLQGLKQVDIVNRCKPIADKYNMQLTKQDLTQYVNGKKEPGQYKLTIMGEALGVSEVWLMGYDVPMQRNSSPEDLTKRIEKLSPEKYKELTRFLEYLESRED